MTTHLLSVSVQHKTRVEEKGMKVAPELDFYRRIHHISRSSFCDDFLSSTCLSDISRIVIRLVDSRKICFEEGAIVLHSALQPLDRNVLNTNVLFHGARTIVGRYIFVSLLWQPYRTITH